MIIEPKDVKIGDMLVYVGINNVLYKWQITHIKIIKNTFNLYGLVTETCGALTNKKDGDNLHTIICDNTIHVGSTKCTGKSTAEGQFYIQHNVTIDDIYTTLEKILQS